MGTFAWNPRTKQPKFQTFMVYLTLSVAQTTVCQTVKRLVTNELRRMWNSVVKVSFQILSRNVTEDIRQDGSGL
jgi:hypothetical protein